MIDHLNSHIVVEGQLVSAKVSRIVEAIHDYEPELEVKWIPPAGRKPDQAAYAIVHNAPGNSPYILFYITNDEDFDERVLWRIIHNDQRNGKRQLSEIEAWEKAQQLVQKQAYLDALEQANDIAYHILKTPLNTYRVNKDFVVQDGIPFNAAKRR